MKTLILFSLSLLLAPVYAVESIGEISHAATGSGFELENCISDPLPTEPKLPNVSFFANVYRGKVEMTVWREACMADSSVGVLLLRVEPVPTDSTALNPTIRGDEFSVRQDSVLYNNIDLVETIDPFTIFNGQVSTSTTFAIDQNAVPYFDPNDAFTLIYSDWVNGAVPVDIPAYSEPEVDAAIIVNIEEPADNSVVTGVRNLRGWAVGPEGIDHVEYYIDGALKQIIPYGGARNDVANVYPEHPDSDFSGFSAAHSWGLQSPGTHTITVRAIATSGNYNEVTNTFEVTQFHEPFFPDPEDVDISASRCVADGDSVLLNNVKVEDILYNVRLQWQVPSQGFGIIDIY